MREKPELLPGRRLYCWDCNGFQRAKVYLDGDPPDLRKVIMCRVCGNEQARLVPWGDDEWINSMFVENLAYVVATTVGLEAVASGLEMEEDAAISKLVKEQQQVKRVRVKKARKTGLRKVRLSFAILAVFLGSLHLVLTALAIQYQIYIWPFTEIWSEFMWMGVENVILGGILAASTAVALGILGAILGRGRGR